MRRARSCRESGGACLHAARARTVRTCAVCARAVRACCACFVCPRCECPRFACPALLVCLPSALILPGEVQCPCQNSSKHSYPPCNCGVRPFIGEGEGPPDKCSRGSYRIRWHTDPPTEEFLGCCNCRKESDHCAQCKRRKQEAMQRAAEEATRKEEEAKRKAEEKRKRKGGLQEKLESKLVCSGCRVSCGHFELPSESCLPLSFFFRNKKSAFTACAR